MRRVWLFPLLYVALCANAAAALPEVYRAALESGVQSGLYRDVAVGWIQDKERSSAFFGAATADSRFEIGAVTEIFTGVLLAREAIDGKRRPKTTLHECLPGISLSDAIGALTLQDLMTHRSGLPSLPWNLFPLDADDPFATYTASDLRAFLARYPAGADAAAGYSPLDAGLVGFALGSDHDGGFAALLRDKVLVPMGLKQTGLDDDGLLSGNAGGVAAVHWHFGVLAGSAGLRSGVGDLLDLLQANLTPEKSPLRAALLLARQAQGDSTRAQVGLGWNIKETPSNEETWPLLWRASTTAGFATFIGFRTDRQQALVLLSDTDADLSALGIAVLEDRLPPPLPRAPQADATPVLLNDYVGLYKVRNGAEVVVRANQDALSLQLRGEPATLLRRVGNDVFESAADALNASFQREASTVASVLLTRAGASVLAQRLTQRPPHLARAAVEVDSKHLDEFSGDYRLSSDTLLRMTRHDGALSMQLTGRGAQALLAFAPDRFACADDSCEIAFRRDETGKPVGAEVDFAGGQHSAARLSPNVPEGAAHDK